MQLTQVELISGNRKLVTWIDNKKVNKSNIILKEYPGTVWRIKNVYATVDSAALHSDWKVGGI